MLISNLPKNLFCSNLHSKFARSYIMLNIKWKAFVIWSSFSRYWSHVLRKDFKSLSEVTTRYFTHDFEMPWDRSNFVAESWHRKQLFIHIVMITCKSFHFKYRAVIRQSQTLFLIGYFSILVVLVNLWMFHWWYLIIGLKRHDLAPFQLTASDICHGQSFFDIADVCFVK